MTVRPTIEALSNHLSHLFPTLDATDQRLSLALYHALAAGAPVAVPALAATLDMPADEAARRLQSWPGVYYDDTGRVIGYWGLALRPTTHRLRVKCRELYAWCAWDTLFLPALLDATAEIESMCRGSGQPVRLMVGPGAVEVEDPAELVVSFLLPQADAVRANVITSFCDYVHFFRSLEVAQTWLDEHPQAFLLSLGEAYEVGRRETQGRYGALLSLH